MIRISTTPVQQLLECMKSSGLNPDKSVYIYLYPKFRRWAPALLCRYNTITQADSSGAMVSKSSRTGALLSQPVLPLIFYHASW